MLFGGGGHRGRGLQDVGGGLGHEEAGQAAAGLGFRGLVQALDEGVEFVEVGLEPANNAIDAVGVGQGAGAGSVQPVVEFGLQVVLCRVQVGADIQDRGAQLGRQVESREFALDVGGVVGQLGGAVVRGGAEIAG